METKVLDGQSTIDIAIQTGGSVESVFDLAIKNGLSITDSLSPSQVLTTPVVTNALVLEYYNMKGLRPATDTDSEAEQGIEFWYIEHDFIVS